MTWVRLDENLVDHPKIAGLSDRAFRLWITSLAYANRYETDGKLERNIAERFLKRGERARRELVEAGLWHENGVGYVIHDYLDYQPSRAENCDLRAKRAAAGRIGGKKSRPPSKPEASASHVLEAKRKPVPSDLYINQEDLIDQAIIALLLVMGEPEHGQARLELAAFKARGASENDFRVIAEALPKRRPRAPRAYARTSLENRLRERSTA